MEKSEKWTSTSEASILGEDEFLIAQAATDPLLPTAPGMTSGDTTISNFGSSSSATGDFIGDAPVTAEGAPALGDAPAPGDVPNSEIILPVTAEGAPAPGDIPVTAEGAPAPGDVPVTAESAPAPGDEEILNAEGEEADDGASPSNENANVAEGGENAGDALRDADGNIIRDADGNIMRRGQLEEGALGSDALARQDVPSDGAAGIAGDPTSNFNGGLANGVIDNNMSTSEQDGLPGMMPGDPAFDGMPGDMMGMPGGMMPGDPAFDGMMGMPGGMPGDMMGMPGGMMPGDPAFQALMAETGGAAAMPGFDYNAHIAATGSNFDPALGGIFARA